MFKLWRWTERLSDWLFGYDFFISYAHADGHNYPRKLKLALESRGYRIFLDEEGIFPGDDLPLATRRQVRKSRYLLVVVRAVALVRPWVLEEVRISLSAKRVVIPIDVGGVLTRAQDDLPLKQVLKDRVWLSDPVEPSDADPSLSIVDKLHAGFRGTQQDRLRFHAVAFAAFVFAVVAMGAAGLYVEAERQRALAEKRGRLSVSRELAASAITQLPSDPERSVLLAIQAREIAPTQEAEDALRRSLMSSHLRATLHGHRAAVSAIAYSQGGHFLATSSEDGTARVWEASTGAERAVLRGHRAPLTSVAFHPSNPAVVVTASRDGTARVWEVNGETMPRVLSGHHGRVFGALFAGKGDMVVTAGEDRTVRIWNTNTGELTRILDKHRVPVGILAVSPNGRFLATAGGATEVWVYDLRSFTRVARLDSQGVGLHRLRFSHDGKFLVASSGDLWTAYGDCCNPVRIWDVNNWRLTAELLDHATDVYDATMSSAGVVASVDTSGEGRLWHRFGSGLNRRTKRFLLGHAGAIRRVSFTPDNEWLVTVGDDGTARVWDAQTGVPVAVMPGHAGPLTDLTISPDGRTFATASEDGTARVWDRGTGNLIADLHRAILMKAVFAPNGRRILTLDNNGRLKLWDGITGSEVTLRQGSSSVMAVAFSPDSALVAASRRNSLAVWSAESGEQVTVIPVGSTHWSRLVFGPDGEILYRAGASTVAWNVRSLEPVPLPRGHRFLRLTSDGKQLFTLGSEGSVWSWNTKSWQPHLLLKRAGDRLTLSPSGDWVATWDHAAVYIWDALGKRIASQNIADVSWVEFTPNGAHLLVGKENGTVDVRRIPTGEAAAVIGERDRVHAVTRPIFSPSGALALIVHESRRTSVWQTDEWRRETTILGRPSPRGVFSPDERFIITTPANGMAQIHDLQTGSVVALLRGHRGMEIATAEFSPDGRRVVMASHWGASLYACDTCVSGDELMHTAQARVTRPLTKSESRQFLHPLP